jgi:hypothetical protein
MKILLTLDYEIFFGENSNFNLSESLLKPTEKFVYTLSPYGAKAVFFVDAGFICALQRESAIYSSLKKDLAALENQIQWLERAGHEIQLHVHPHWEDSFFDGVKWHVITKRYRLDQFTKEKAEEIFTRYHSTLQNIVKRKITAYRAGGWCIQPFEHIAEAMKNCAIQFDSTVYAGGYESSETHYYDFKDSPEKDFWKFSMDPVKEDQHGSFIEIPIAAHRVSPLFFWQLMYSKIFGDKKEAPNGNAIQPSKRKIIKKLLTRSHDTVSIDGEKSKLVLSSIKRGIKLNKKYFVIIGHPKMFSNTTYSHVRDVLQFIQLRGGSVVGFADIKNSIHVS